MLSTFTSLLGTSAAAGKTVLIVPAPQMAASSYQAIADLMTDDNTAVHIVDSMPPSYSFDYTCASHVKSALQKISQDGGDLVLVGHAWGGNCIQKIVHDKTDLGGWNVDSLVLLSSVVKRDYVELIKDGDEQGKSQISLDNKKVLQLSGELDGLMRVSRVAEAYYHTKLNVEEAQKDQVKSVIMKGVNHASFLTGDGPSYLKGNDLKAEASAEDSQNAVADAIKSFISTGVPNDDLDTAAFLDPLYQSMVMEGYEQFKPPCYDSDIKNPDSKLCSAGSPWVTQIAHNMMADDEHFKNKNVKFVNHDEFHRADSVAPYHHPEIISSCTLDDKDCTFEAYSVNQNTYNSVTDFTKLEKFQVAAWEQRTKMKARQTLKIKSGETDADFHVNDEVGDRCAEINQAALDWALKRAPAETVARYQSSGQKMKMIADRNTINGGLWIYDWMTYTETDDKSAIELASLAYRMSYQFPVPMFAGDHYCKLLTPFKAMEWLYVDSLYPKSAFSAVANGPENVRFLNI